MCSRALTHVFLLSACLCQAQVPFHHAYTTADGLASDLVFSACEDDEGYLWFCTDAGVSRFDGMEFQNLGPVNGLSDKEVLSVFQDSQRRIWFLTLNGSLSFWLNGVVHNGSTDPLLESYIATSSWINACEDREGLLWFSSLNGEVLRLDMVGGRSRMFHLSNSVSNVFVDSMGKVVVLAGEKMVVIEGDSITSGSDLPEGWFRNHVLPPRVYGTDAVGLVEPGVIRIAAKGVRLLEVPVRVNKDEHSRVEQDRSGNLWVYRRISGVEFIRKEGAAFAGPHTHFPEWKINSVHVANNGDRWYCTASKGVIFTSGELEDRTEWHVTDPGSGSAFISIGAGTGTLWLGSDLGGVYEYTDQGLVKRFEQVPERLLGRILCTAQDIEGTSWFGTDFGLFRHSRNGPDELVPVQAHCASAPLGLIPLAPAKGLLISRSGRVYSPGIGLWYTDRSSTGSIRVRYPSERVPHLRISCIAEDALGRIWFPNGSELYGMAGDSIWSYPIPKAYMSSRITDILPWAPDTLALATSGHGVLLWSEGKVVGPMGHGVTDHSMVVRSMTLQGDTLYCATSKGVLVYLRSGADGGPAWRWSIAEGLPTNDVRDVLPVGGRLLMATALGLCVAPLRPYRKVGTIRNLKIARILVNDSLLQDMNGEVTLRSGDRLVVEFRAIEFARTDEVEYVYALGEGPSFAAPSGRVTIDRLDEGTHVIRMKARVGNGVWSDERTVEVSVEPPWWATRIARVVAALAGLAVLLFALEHWSRRRFQKQLDGARAQAAITEERRRIAADVHDDLGADLSRVLMGLRMADPLDGAASVRAITEANKGLTAAMQHMDEIIWSLDPQRDTLLATANFIETYAVEFAAQHKLEIISDVRLNMESAIVGAHARREIFLVVREALRNVAQHSHAKHLTLKTWSQRELFCLEICDDGSGFLANGTKRDGRGIRNMRERMEGLGGRLTIDRSPSGGTRVMLSMDPSRNPSIGGDDKAVPGLNFGFRKADVAQ